jgi:hypothetical protein
MSAATILAGMLREVQPHAIILAAGTRIALPPDLSAKDVPEGSSVLVTMTRSERGSGPRGRLSMSLGGTGEGSRAQRGGLERAAHPLRAIARGRTLKLGVIFVATLWP